MVDKKPVRILSRVLYGYSSRYPKGSIKRSKYKLLFTEKQERLLLPGCPSKSLD
jgi:hypothetical protein